MTDTSAEIHSRVKREVGRNSRAATFNNFLFNYGWALASAASIMAGFIDDNNDLGLPGWAAPAMGIFAAIWIAVDKRLSFGKRWQFHLRCQQAFAALGDRIVLLKDCETEAVRLQKLEKIVADLRLEREKCANIPGAE